jgi:hypothetical protein
MKTILESILAQPVIHLLSYAGVLVIFGLAVGQSCVLHALKKKLTDEAARLGMGNLKRPELAAMLHPLGKCLLRFLELPAGNAAGLRRAAEYAEASLFIPLKSRIVFCRDASTVAGLVATLIAIYTASGEFAHSGKAELLVGSVGNGVVATVIAAIACLLALGNASTLSHLRLSVAMQCEELFLEPLESGSLPPAHRVAVEPAETESVAEPTTVVNHEPEKGWAYVI